MTNAPKVFISYSHDNQTSDEHKVWVRKLATNLRESMGIDVVFDQWDLRIGSDLSLFMEQGLSDSVLVLCICSDKYTEKANKGKGGVGYEKMIMTIDLLADTSTDYIIPVKRNNKSDKMPTFLGTKLYIDFSNDEEYLEKLSELTYRIYDEDIAQKPTLGANPFAKNNFGHLDMKIITEKTKYHNVAMQGNVSFDFSNNNGEFTIGTGEYQFNTRWSECGNDTIYALKDSVKCIGYTPHHTAFPAKETLDTAFDFTSRVRTVSVGEVVVWVNAHNNFALTKVTDIKVRSRGADEDCLEFEYLIYQ